MTDTKKIQDLVAKGNVEKALDELLLLVEDSEMRNNILTIKGTYSKAKNDSLMGIITNAELGMTSAKTSKFVLDTLSNLPEQNSANSSKPTQNKTQPTVFISYNHNDKNTANHLKYALRANGIEVTIDSEAMPAGADIKTFIEDSVKNTDVTLSLASKNSLVSGWVAMETIETFYLSKFDSNKRFIACFLDDSFMQRDFVLKSTQAIDAKIKEINDMVMQYIGANLDTIDLNTEKTRLHELRNNLGKIVLKLKDSKSVDLTGDKMEQGIQEIIKSIKM